MMKIYDKFTIKNGLYVVTLGQHIFTELDEDNDRYALYAFTHHGDASNYLNSFAKEEDLFKLKLYTINQLWDYLQPFKDDTDVVVASCNPGGNPLFHDFLFPSEDCTVH